jgi:hypothetical protein
VTGGGSEGARRESRALERQGVRKRRGGGRGRGGDSTTRTREPSLPRRLHLPTAASSLARSLSNFFSSN